MCGIAGIFNYTGAPVDPGLATRFTRLLAHRGPDDEGLYCKDHIALGHRRLSIIDLTPSGHQPMANDDGSIWIVYNGECYNFRELMAALKSRGHRFRSSSDTEVILRLYEERGLDCLRELDGMFALAIWDARKQTLLLARDRLGIKPLYYFDDGNHVAFASELKALLADPAFTGDVDYSALSDFLHLMSIPGDHTIFSAAKKLLPAHYLLVSKGRVTTAEYWNLSKHQPRRMTFQDACSHFDRLFHQRAASHLVSDVPVGAFLSGGVDSSSVVAAARRGGSQDLDTFSITFPGLDEFDESSYAKQVAQHCGTRHHEFSLTPNLLEELPKIVWHADEPFAISSGFAVYFLARLARQHVKVVLTGDGSDEIFAGYPWRHVSFDELPSRIPQRLRVPLSSLVKRLVPFTTGRVRQRLRQFVSRDERYVDSFVCFRDSDLVDLLQPEPLQRVRSAWQDNITQRYFDAAQGADQLWRKLYTDVKTTLVSEMLTKVDRMTMAFGLEARVPFLDHHLVEWAFEVPSAYKIRGSDGKHLVKKAMETYLPHEILHRPKQGFNVPLKMWMRDELREFVLDHLSESVLRRRGLMQPNGVMRLIERHFKSEQDASNKIFTLLMLELWYQRFVDQRSSFRLRDNADSHFVPVTGNYRLSRGA